MRWFVFHYNFFKVKKPEKNNLQFDTTLYMNTALEFQLLLSNDARSP